MIVFFDVEPWEKSYLQERLGKKCIFVSRSVTPQSASRFKNAEVLSVFIYSRVNEQVLNALPKLKFIATRSTGFDHVDLQACAKRGVLVANVPSYGENTVAEHTFGLILALSRKIHKTYERTVRGDFSLEGLRGFDLQGKTIGVIGTGHIGKHVVRIAKGFEMNVLSFDPKPDESFAKQTGVNYVSLDRLLEESDIVSLHAPLNDKTRHLIDRKNLRKMKKTALLINTARGALVDTEALAEAIAKKWIAGAGLDVLEGEEFVKEEKQLLTRQFSEEKLKTLVRSQALLHHENVIITPHNAFNSQEALERISVCTIENIESFLKGKPKNLVGTNGG